MIRGGHRPCPLCGRVMRGGAGGWEKFTHENRTEAWTTLKHGRNYPLHTDASLPCSDSCSNVRVFSLLLYVSSGTYSGRRRCIHITRYDVCMLYVVCMHLMIYSYVYENREHTTMYERLCPCSNLSHTLIERLVERRHYKMAYNLRI